MAYPPSFQRTRTDGNHTALVTWKKLTQCNGAVTLTSFDEVTDGVGGEDLLNGITRETTDVVTPGYAARSKMGEVFNNPYSSVKVTRKSFPIGEWDHYWIPNCTNTPTSTKALAGNYSYGCWGGLMPRGNENFTAHYATLATLAGTQARANVASPAVLGGEFMADADRTLKGVLHPLDNLAGALQDIRKSNKYAKAYGRSALTLGAFVAQEWLRYRYGIVPLVNDVKGAFEAVYKPVFTDRKTARGKADWPLQEVQDSVDIQTTTRNATTERYASFKESVRAGILYQHRVGLQEDFGAHFNSLVPTLWEILPWSFVGDWFYNVGDYLSAVIPKGGTVVLAEWTSSKVEHAKRSVMTSTPRTVTNLAINGGPAMYCSYEHVSKTRTPGVSIGLSNRLNDLTLSKSKTWYHAADAFALVGGLLYSKRGGKIVKRPPRDRVRAQPRDWVGTYDSRPW
jgi:hypothetical protein